MPRKWLLLLSCLTLGGCDLIIEATNPKNRKPPTVKQREEWERLVRQQEFDAHMERQNPDYGKRRGSK